jgi:hypothetical protein
VLETQEEHPKKLLFEVFGEDKIKEFDIKQDEVLTVSFDPKVDEKDGHYYGKNRAFAVSRDSFLLQRRVVFGLPAFT